MTLVLFLVEEVGNVPMFDIISMFSKRPPLG